MGTWKRHAAGVRSRMPWTGHALTLAALSREADLHFITCAGPMGADLLQKSGCTDSETVYTFTGESSASDTVEAARRIRDAGARHSSSSAAGTGLPGTSSPRSGGTSPFLAFPPG